MKSTLKSPHLQVGLFALALTGGALVVSQSVMAEPEVDPFLQAMMEEQKEADAKPQQAPQSEEDIAKSQEALRKAVMEHDPRFAQQAAAMESLQGESGIFGMQQSIEGKNIADVVIRAANGQQNVPAARLKDQIATKAGQKFSSSRANSDLERLVKAGLIAPNSRVLVDEKGNSLTVIFEVGTANFMGGVGFTGNKRFDDGDLRELTKLKPGLVMNDQALSKARADIVQEYQESYYPDTKVAWREVRTQRPGYNDVIFDITEGDEIDMVAIRFEGNKQFDAEQLRQLMSTKELDWIYFLTKSGRIDREKLREDLDKLVTHYRNFGYLRARIADVQYSDAGKPGHQKLHMNIRIEEGDRYYVRNVSFKGNKVYTSQELEPGMSMLDGDIYSLKKVQDDITMIRKYYGAKGYADANVHPDVTEVGVDAKGHRLIDICYDMTEGNRFLVGNINVRGNEKTRQHVILRELPLHSGDNLNSVDLETARKRLQNLGYFAGVEVSQASSDVPGYRDININVAEKATGQVTFGIAFSSVENLYLYGNVTQSNFDIRGLSNGVFVGGGQRLSAGAKLGTEYSSASITLLEPWFLDRKLSYSNELFFTSSQYLSDYYEQTNYGYSTYLRKALSDLTSIKLQYRLERYDIKAESDAPTYFAEADGDYVRSNVALSFEYDTRDAVVTPRKGGDFDIGLNYSGPGSTVQTYGLSVSGSYYYNSIWDSILSVNFGYQTVKAVDSDEMVPIFERCFLGGPNNLRGFAYHDVGLVDEALTGDETMGGNTSFYAQFEVSIPIVNNIRFATFIDVGFVQEDSFQMSPDGFAADFGVGIRMDMGMGPMAIDFAFPIKSDNAIDDGMQVQFYIDYKY